MTGNLILAENIEPLILVLRDQKVLMDRDLAILYGTTTKRLNQAVQRNLDRFPPDFMFQLDALERDELVAGTVRFQRLKHTRALPYAFTEHGAIMAASVLNSPQAVETSIFVVRAFVKLRQLMTTHKELARKLAELERKLGDHDDAIAAIMSAIKRLMDPPPGPPKPKIGFRA